MASGAAGGNVIHTWRTVAGPSMSASTTTSPGWTRRLGAPLRPPWAVPPAPRAPVGFSNVMARDSCPCPRCDGSNGNMTPAPDRLLDAAGAAGGRAAHDQRWVGHALARGGERPGHDLLAQARVGRESRERG